MSQLSMFNAPRIVQRSGKWKPPEKLPELRGKYDDIIFDAETTGLKVWGNDKPVSFGVMTRADKKTWFFPWAQEGGGNLDPELVRRWARTELRDMHVTNLNIKFDTHMMNKFGVDLEAQGCELHEIQHPAALLDEHRRFFNLNALGKDYVNMTKRELPAGALPHQLSSYEIVDYNAQDMLIVDALIDAFEPMIEKENLGRVCALEDELLFAVMEMERNGARLDMPKLDRWIDEVKLAYQDLIIDIWRDTFLRINPDSPKDMKKLYDHLGLNYGLTGAGQPSFTKEALAANSHPLVQKALAARQINSLKNKFLVKYRRASQDGILRYALHQMRGDEYGTITGRFSAANVNIQQVMKPSKQALATLRWILRELFIPEPGAFWLSADASQIEFRLFAHYSNSQRLIKAYNDNPWIDFHQMVTDMIRKVVPGYQRVYAKNFNFMKLYGGGRDKAAFMLGLTRDEVDPLLDAYDEEFPEVKRLMRRSSRLAERRHYVKTYLGRRRRYDDQIDTRYYSALNAVIQGTAADIMKKKLLEIYRERKTLGIIKLRFPVHDEIDGDVDSPERRDQIQKFLNQQSYPFDVPIMWEVDVSDNWRCGWQPEEN